jgi:hypothetical protein
MDDETKRHRFAAAEAGKAMMSLMLGRPAYPLSLPPFSPEKTLEKSDPFLPSHLRDFRRQRALAEEQVLFALSGLAAVRLLVDNRTGLSRDDPDVQSAYDAARSICGSEAECTAFVEWLWQRCVALLSLPPRPERMGALAEQLLRKGNLSEREVLRFL